MRNGRIGSAMRIPVRLAVPAAAALALVGALAGCGQPMPGLGTASGSLRAFDDPAAGHKEALEKALAELKTLSGRVTYRELDLKDGKFKDSAATFKTDTGKRWIRGFIEKSDKPNAKGAETLFLNDGRLTVKVKIGFVPITRTFFLDDDQVTSGRNYRLDQTDFAAMVQVILAEGAKVESLGTGELLGRKVDILDVRPAGLPDAAHERIGLDPATHLPVARVCLAAKADSLPALGASLWVSRFTYGATAEEQAIFSAVVDGERLNPELPPATWKL